MGPANHKRRHAAVKDSVVMVGGSQKGNPSVANPKRKRLDLTLQQTETPPPPRHVGSNIKESNHTNTNTPLVLEEQNVRPAFSLYEALRDLKKSERSALDSIFNNPLPRNAEATQAAATVRDLLKQVRNKRLNQQQDLAQSINHAINPPQREPAFEEAIALSSIPTQAPSQRSYRCPAVARTPWSRWFLFRCGNKFVDDSLCWSPPHRPGTEQLCKWWSEQPFTRRLHHEIAAFACWCELTPYEVRRRQEILARVHFIAKAIWPECEMVPFGSFVTGLCLPEGDMDICICNVPVAKPAEAVQILAKALKRSRFTRQITPITKARIPIVKYVDAAYGISVDISINQDSSADTTNLVRDKLKEWPMMRPLILILKETLRQWELGETYRGGIGSYLLFCMTLHHLQHTEKLAEKDLGELLIGFLARFSYFDYYLDGIDVRGRGRLIVKADMRDGGPVDALLCVASPLEPTTDCGRNSYKIEDIVARLKRRLDRLQSLRGAEQRASELRDFQLLREIRESSLLSAVINCNDRILESRRVPASHPEVSGFNIYESRPQFFISEQVFEDVYRRLSNSLDRIADPYGGRSVAHVEKSRPSLKSITTTIQHQNVNATRRAVRHSASPVRPPPAHMRPPLPPTNARREPSVYVSHVVHASPEYNNRVVSIPDDSDDDEEEDETTGDARDHLKTMNRVKSHVEPWLSG